MDKRQPQPIPFRKMRCFFAVAALAALAAAAGIVFHADFHDIGAAAGLTARNTFGGTERKDFILETTGNGAAILDYDGDGRDDIFIANGRRLKSKGEPAAVVSQRGRRAFPERRETGRPDGSRMGARVCVGDYDNDGRPDLLVTFYGHNVLYRNRGDGTFEDATEKAKLPVAGIRYGSGCSFVDYDRMGIWTCLSPTT